VNLYELSKPYIKVICSTSILLIVTIFIAPQIREGWKDITRLSMVTAECVLTILIAAIFSPLWLKKGLDELSKRHNATKRLDKHSLILLATMNGLTYREPALAIDVILALRHLTSLELIELDVFPISFEKVSWGYYLTDLGRYILTEKLEKKELFPKKFCELIRIRYWQGHSPKFITKKRAYKRNIFSLSWDGSWKRFEKIIRKIEPNHPEKDTMEIFEEYLPGKAYDIVMTELVIPWQKERN